MAQTTPYQPVLLRLLHGLVGALVVFALVTGFWVYNTYDHRWLRLPLPEIADSQGIHGTGALIFLLVLPFFVLYCFHLGARRLIQPKSLANLKQIDQNKGWAAWQKLLNTLILLAATFAVITGRLMKEEWLPRGELHHLAYSGHLLAWGLMLVAVVLHIGLGHKVGGVPLIRSMFQLRLRTSDRPKTWFQGWTLISSKVLLAWEVVILAGIALAFILPAFI